MNILMSLVEIKSLGNALGGNKSRKITEIVKNLYQLTYFNELS